MGFDPLIHKHGSHPCQKLSKQTLKDHCDSNSQQELRQRNIAVCMPVTYPINLMANLDSADPTLPRTLRRSVHMTLAPTRQVPKYPLPAHHNARVKRLSIC